MDILLLSARLLLVLVFLVAGVAKLRDRPGTRQAIVDFGLPAPLARPLAVLLPPAELMVGVAIAPVGTAWWGTLLAMALLLAFSLAMAANLALGRRPDCHCFGRVGAGAIGWQTLLRNALLMLAAGLVLAVGPGPSALAPLAWLGRLTEFQAITLAGGVAGLLLLGFQGWFLLQLVAQNGRLLLRLEALEGRLPAPGGASPMAPPAAAPRPEPGVGGVAPPFALPDLAGSVVTLEALLAAGKPVLLVFVDPGCVPCATLLPDVAAWQRERVDLKVVVVSRGSREANLAKSAEHGLGLVLLQRDLEVAEPYRAVGTPSAVLVRPDGTLGSAVAAGAERIRSLVVGHPSGMAQTAGGRKPPASNGSRPAPHPHGGRIGQPAPAMRLRDLAGGVLDLADYRGQRVLVLFWNPGCGFCQRMLGDLKAWEADPPEGAPRLVVLSTGSVEENLGMGLRSPVGLEDGFGTGRAFGATGTPSAVLVDEDGRIASQVASGAPAVLALARAPRERRNGAVHVG